MKRGARYCCGKLASIVNSRRKSSRRGGVPQSTAMTNGRLSDHMRENCCHHMHQLLSFADPKKKPKKLEIDRGVDRHA